MPAGRRACIAIDDFGLHDGINQAAGHLVQAGRVHAIGCQVGGPAWADGVRILRSLPAEHVDIGLHLDLTEVPLRPDAARPLGRLVVSAYLGLLDDNALRRQVRAQLDGFTQAVGRLPDYIDGHQHVHQLPGVRSALLDELSRIDAAHRPWLRSTMAPAGLRAAGLPWFKPRVIQALGALPLVRQASGQGFAMNRRLLGVYDFRGGGGRYAQLLAGWLHAMAEGDLLMCHPSMGARPGDPLHLARDAEFRVLAGDSLVQLCQRAGIRLEPMRHILGRRRTGAGR